MIETEYGAAPVEKSPVKRDIEEGVRILNGQPKRARVYLDKANAVNGQTKSKSDGGMECVVAWKTVEKKSTYFDRNKQLLSELDGFDTQVY